MKTQDIRHKLRTFTENWPFDSTYLIWGASHTAEYFLRQIGGDFSVAAFLDSDPQKQAERFHGKGVLSLEEYLQEWEGQRLIVASIAYPEIRDRLRANGKTEFVDFCDSRYFLSAHSIVRDNKLMLARTDLSVTEHCNLRCRDCNMLMPHFSHPQHRDPDELKAWIDAYFRWVDQVQIFHLLGGEPFLYPHLAEIVRYLCEHYRERIDRIVFFSNALILPSDELLALMESYDLEVQVSDYRSGLPQVAGRVDRFCHILAEHGIRFRSGVDERWISFGFPDYLRPAQWSGDPIAFFDACYAPFRGLYQKRLYYCHLEASAEAAGLFCADENDFFDLSIYDESRKIELAGFDLGYTKLGDLAYCSRCKGCFSVNQAYVPVAAQMER